MQLPILDLRHCIHCIKKNSLMLIYACVFSVFWPWPNAKAHHQWEGKKGLYFQIKIKIKLFRSYPFLVFQALYTSYNLCGCWHS